MKDKKLLKNYIILIVIYIIVFFVMLYISRWWHVYNDYKLEIPVIRGTLNYEITDLEFDNYILENPNSIVYMCTSDNTTCRSFEKDFKKVIEKRELQNDIIYVNLTNTDIESFVNRFNNKYKYKIKLTKDYPALVEFIDGKVAGLVEGSEDEALTINRASTFLSVNHIGEDE